MSSRMKYGIHYLILNLLLAAVLLWLVLLTRKSLQVSALPWAVGLLCAAATAAAVGAVWAEKRTRPQTVTIPGESKVLIAVLGVELEMEAHRALTSKEGGTKVYEWVSRNPLRERYRRWLTDPIAITPVPGGVVVYGPANVLTRLQKAVEQL